MAKYVSKNPAPVVEAFQYIMQPLASTPEWFRDAIVMKKIQFSTVISPSYPEDRMPDLVVNKPYGEPNTCKMGDWVAKLTYADGSVQYTFYEDKYFNDNFAIVIG